MYAYCNNNPVMYSDPTGEMCIREAGGGGLYGYCGSFSTWGGYSGGGAGGYVHVEYMQTVKPAATVLTVTGFSAGVGVAYVVSEIDTLRSEMIQIKSQPKTNKEDNDNTIIYRYYATSDSNLAPRDRVDYDGLSFLTTPPKSHQLPAVMTTIGAIKETGLFVITQKGNHVALSPNGIPVENWMLQGMNSIWSNTLATIVVEWDG